MTYSMYRGVSLNTATGKWYASTPTIVTIQPGSYLTGYTMSGDNRILRSYNGTADQLEVIYDGMRSRYVKDTFIENVIGTDAEYPLDGRVGGYWYIRTNQLNDIAIITQPNGGETLNEEYEIKWTRTADDTNTDIELSFDNGLSWKRIASNNLGTSYTYDFTNETETSTARIRTRAVKGVAVGGWTINSGVFTILHDFAPQAPTNLSPSSEIIDRTEVVQLRWQHNHPNAQSKFNLRWSTDQASWNDIARNTTNQYYDAPESLFPAGNIYWQVQTYSDAGIISPWSNVATFISAIPSDAPTITSANTTAIARPTLTWSQVDQVAYQLQVLNSINVVIWDTGEVNSVNKARTIEIDLLNNSIYKVRIRTKTNLGLWTAYTEQFITVSYTPPAIPIINLTQDKFSIIINIENPEPTGTEPNVSYNDVYRDGIRIATNVLGSYKDYGVASGKTYNYQVIAVGENGSIRDSLFHQGQIEIEYAVLTNKEGHFFRLDTELKTIEKKNYDGFRLKFAGRPKSVAQFSEHEEEFLEFIGVIYREEDMEKFRELAANRKAMLYRDHKGRKMFGVVFGYEIIDIELEDVWHQLAFRFEEVDYKEEI